ncbi:hypothetical protein [Streptomyces sp. NPDC051569]|uniref:hypothetical protein n=1 Tax=Streptomyces sp. NPDC051569 TaxID=3365661 RepID=UPI00379166B5
MLRMPWTLLAHVLLWVSHIDSWLLGYNFSFDSPNWLFEPVWLIFVPVAALLNARIISGPNRRVPARRPGRPAPVVPFGMLAFFGGIILLFRV